MWRIPPDWERGGDSRCVGSPTPRARTGASGARSALRYTAATVSTAVIVFDFDPILRLGDLAVPLETAALGVTILLVLLLAARIGTRVPANDPSDAGDAAPRGLRADDLLFVVLGILPGAVVGGRLGYVLLHLDYYRIDPGAIVDPRQGSLELSLAVAGGALTGAYVASLLDGAVGRWLHAAALPVLLALGLGKLAMALGGTGQGQPTNAEWATAYVGGHSWASLAPEIPSHPSQLYEGGVALGVLVLLVILLAGGAFASKDGRLFLAGVALWSLGRAVVAGTWRDAEVLGPLRAGQLLALGLALVALTLAAAAWRSARRGRAVPAASRDAVGWPGRETPPRF